MIAGLGLFAKTAGLSRPARATCLHSVGALAGIEPTTLGFGGQYSKIKYFV